jgi:hypothetical protein
MSASPFENHLRVVGEGEYSLRIRTGGWFEKVETSNLGSDDKSHPEDNGRKLFLTIHGKKDTSRQVDFTVRPTGAPVFVDGTRDGRPLRVADISCGESAVVADEIPARFPEVEGVNSENEQNLKNNVLLPPAKKRPGLELWLTPTRTILFEGNREALCALGYADCKR